MFEIAALVVLMLVVATIRTLVRRSKAFGGRRGLNALADATGPMSKLAKRSALLTPAETDFYHSLRAATGDHYHISCQTRLADLLHFPRSLTPSEKTRLLNRLARKHVDFVLCDPRTMAIVAAIELDDSSHLRAERVERDQLVNAALASAGVPLLRVEVRNLYKPHELLLDLRLAIKGRNRNNDLPQALIDKLYPPRGGQCGARRARPHGPARAEPRFSRL